MIPLHCLLLIVCMRRVVRVRAADAHYLASHTNRSSRNNRIQTSADPLIVCAQSAAAASSAGEDSISAGVWADDAVRARDHHELGTRLELGGESIVYFNGDPVTAREQDDHEELEPPGKAEGVVVARPNLVAEFPRSSPRGSAIRPRLP
jgi:hypothetical protein